MSEARPNDIELILSRVLSPVEPPQRLREQFTERLERWTEDAVDEIEAWELSAMRDPRNWGKVVKPAAAVAVTATAGTALVLMRAHGRSREQKSLDPFEAVERTGRLIAAEARRILRR